MQYRSQACRHQTRKIIEQASRTMQMRACGDRLKQSHASHHDRSTIDKRERESICKSFLCCKIRRQQPDLHMMRFWFCKILVLVKQNVLLLWHAYSYARETAEPLISLGTLTDKSTNASFFFSKKKLKNNSAHMSRFKKIVYQRIGIFFLSIIVSFLYFLQSITLLCFCLMGGWHFFFKKKRKMFHLYMAHFSFVT